MHKSCPQLGSLSLKYFYMTFSPDVKKTLSDNNNRLQPAHILIELILEDGIANEKSLSSIIFILSYKLAIGKMAMQFQQLKKLHVKLCDSELDIRLDVRLLSIYSNQGLEFWN
ncbi:unnamed protein product [Cunninghamella echinulata]